MLLSGSSSSLLILLCLRRWPVCARPRGHSRWRVCPLGQMRHRGSGTDGGCFRRWGKKGQPSRLVVPCTRILPLWLDSCLFCDECVYEIDIVQSWNRVLWVKNLRSGPMRFCDVCVRLTEIRASDFLNPSPCAFFCDADWVQVPL